MCFVCKVLWESIVSFLAKMSLPKSVANELGSVFVLTVVATKLDRKDILQRTNLQLTGLTAITGIPGQLGAGKVLLENSYLQSLSEK